MLHLMRNINPTALGRGVTNSPKLIAPAAIAAGASMFGSMLSSGTALAANSSNRNFAKKQQKGQNEFEEYMTQKYTSVEGQVASARRAGLNPNVVFDNGVSGSASPVPAPTEAQTFDPELGKGFMQAAPILASMKLTDAQADKAKAEAVNIDTKTPMEYAKLQNEVEQGNPLAKLAWENVKLDMDIKQQEVYLKQASVETQRAMTDKFLMESRLMEYDLKELKPLEKESIQQGITQSIAQTHLLYEQGKLTQAETKKALAETYKAYMDAVSNRISANAQAMQGEAALQNAATNEMVGKSQVNLNTSLSVESQSRTVGIREDNETKNATRRFVLKQMEISNEILGKQNAWTNVREFGQFIRDVGVGVGSIAGAAGDLSKLGATATKVVGFGL